MGNNMKAKKRVSLYKKQSVTGWAFLLPATLLIFAMNFYPMLQAFVLSFKTGIGNNQTWGGLSNYARLLKDGVFRTVFHFIGEGLIYGKCGGAGAFVPEFHAVKIIYMYTAFG